MKRFSIPPREERERHSHTMSAYGRMIHYYGRNGVDANINPQNPMDYLGTQKKTAKPRI